MNNNLQPLQFYHGTSTKLNEGDSITSPASRGTGLVLHTGMSELHSYFSSSSRNSIWVLSKLDLVQAEPAMFIMLSQQDHMKKILIMGAFIKALGLLLR